MATTSCKKFCTTLHEYLNNLKNQIKLSISSSWDSNYAAIMYNYTSIIILIPSDLGAMCPNIVNPYLIHIHLTVTTLIEPEKKIKLSQFETNKLIKIETGKTKRGKLNISEVRESKT